MERHLIKMCCLMLIKQVDKVGFGGFEVVLCGKEDKSQLHFDWGGKKIKHLDKISGHRSAFPVTLNSAGAKHFLAGL